MTPHQAVETSRLLCRLHMQWSRILGTVTSCNGTDLWQALIIPLPLYRGSAEKSRMVKAVTPRQTNADDCGVYVLGEGTMMHLCM